MNIFSNIGITELIVILLLALLVVGPERLPELAEKLGKTLRDVRRAYENLTRDLGPELTSIQKSTQELRESVESVRSIPHDMIDSVVKAADLDDTIDELKDVSASVGQIGKTLSDTQKVIRDPIQSAVTAARTSLSPGGGPEAAKAAAEPGELEAEPATAQDAQPDLADAAPTLAEQQGNEPKPMPAEEKSIEKTDTVSMEEEKAGTTSTEQAHG
jgi:sec-independent protein translocase protein TatB